MDLKNKGLFIFVLLSLIVVLSACENNASLIFLKNIEDQTFLPGSTNYLVLSNSTFTLDQYFYYLQANNLDINYDYLYGLAVDDFSDTNDWTILKGNYNVVNFTLAHETAVNSLIQYNPLAITDGIINAKARAGTALASQNFGIAFGIQDKDNYFECLGRVGAGDWRIRQFIGGTASVLNTVSANAPIADMDYNLSVRINGTNVECYSENVLMVSSPIPGYAGGSVGLSTYSSQSYYDNFEIRSFNEIAINIDNGLDNITFNVPAGFLGMRVIQFLGSDGKMDVSSNVININVYDFSSDVTAPIITLIDPTDGNISDGSFINLTFSVIDDYDLLLNCSIDSTYNGINQIVPLGNIDNGTNNYEVYNLNEGIYVWNVMCNDDAGYSSSAPSYFTFYVNISVPYFVESLSNQIVNQSDLFYYDVNCSDAESPVTYYDNSSEWDIDPLTGEISYTYGFPQIGNYSYGIICSDGISNTSGTFNLEVLDTNVPPTFVGGAPIDSYVINVTMPEDSVRRLFNFSLLFEDLNNDTISYLILFESDPNVDCRYNSINDRIIINATNNYTGPAICIIGITDGFVTENYTINITVTPVNDEPVANLSLLNNSSILEDSVNNTFNLTNLVFDVDNTNNQINWSCLSNESNVNVSNGNLLKLLYVNGSNNFYGSVEINCTASDPGSLTSNSSFILNVLPVNDAPTFVNGTPITGYVNYINITEDIIRRIFNFSTLFTDIDGDSLNFTILYDDNSTVDCRYVNITGAPDRIVMDPADNYTGPALCIVGITDGIITENYTINITVLPVNDNPVINFTGINISVLEDSIDNIFNLSDYVYDVDNNDSNITWICTSNETDVIIGTDNINKALLVNATNNFYGPVLVECFVLDLAALQDNGTFILNVIPVNDAPIVNTTLLNGTIIPQYGYLDTINLSGYVFDIDNFDDGINWACFSENPLLNISVLADNATKFLNVTTNNFYGIANITCIAADLEPLYGNDTFWLNITYTGRPPYFVENLSINYTTYEEQLFYLDVNCSDPDGDNVTYSDDSAEWDINSTTGIISSYYNNTQACINNFTYNIFCSDGINTVSQSFNLIVENVNDAPVVNLTPLDYYTIIEDTSSNMIDLSPHVIDIDCPAQDINWTCSAPGFSDIILKMNNTNKLLNVSAVNNWYGNATVTCRASDGLLNDIDTFILQVINDGVDDYVDDVDDTFVSMVNPTTVHGLSSEMQTETDPLNINRMYLKFNLSKIPASSTISSATLELCRKDTPFGRELSVHDVFGNSWQEETMTWMNKADFDAAVISTTLVDGGVGNCVRYYFDVTAIVQEDMAIGYFFTSMMIRDFYEGSDTGAVRFATKDEANTTIRPRLFIVYDSAAPISTPDTTAPVVTLDAPADASILNATLIQFNYTVTDDLAESIDCSLYVNVGGVFSLQQTHYNIVNGASDTFNLTIPNGNYLWNVGCTDAFNFASAPTNNTLTIQTYIPVPGQTVFYSNADTYVQQSNPSMTNGVTSVLQESGQSGSRKRIFMKFDISNITIPITSAFLTLCRDTSAGSIHTLGVYHVANDTWSEMTLNWTNQPALDVAPIITQAVSPGSGCSIRRFDITTLINSEIGLGSTATSLALVNMNENISTGMLPFRSKEYTGTQFDPFINVTW